MKLAKLHLEKDRLTEKAKIKLEEVKLKTERKQAKLREKEMEHERMRWEHEARMAGLGGGRNAGYTGMGQSTFEPQYQPSPQPSHHTPTFVGSHANSSSSSSPAQLGQPMLQDDLAASLPGPSSGLGLHHNQWQLQHGSIQGQGTDGFFGS